MSTKKRLPLKRKDVRVAVARAGALQVVALQAAAVQAVEALALAAAWKPHRKA